MSSPEYLFKCTNLSIYETTTTLKSVLVSWSCTLWVIIIFYGDSTTLTISPTPKSEDFATPKPPVLMPMAAKIRNPSYGVTPNVPLQTCSSVLLNQLQWLLLAFRITFYLAFLTYHILSTSTPIYLQAH